MSSTGIKCTARTISRDILWLSAAGLLNVTHRPDTSSAKCVPATIAEALRSIDSTGKMSQRARRNVSKRLPVGESQSLRTPYLSSVSMSQPLERDKKETKTEPESKSALAAVDALLDEGVRYRGKAIELVAQYGEDVVHEVIARGKHRAPHVRDRGTFLMRMMASHGSECDRAMAVEAVKLSLVVSCPAPAETRVDAITRDENDDDTAAIEAHVVSYAVRPAPLTYAPEIFGPNMRPAALASVDTSPVDDTPKRHTSDSYYMLSDADRVTLTARARALMRSGSRPDEIRSRAIALLREEQARESVI